ncbi:RNA recognition motif family protein [Puccinia sorghi]|uniref:RNA recognition motif family protein n=1 Tax=Puccinia sorghi TaxID=27349 RepID=A0A0L6V9L2_9BASI|nr:RNA recognition motif family protein [Puccinia sorghi]
MDMNPECPTSAINYPPPLPVSINIHSGSRILISGLPADVTGVVRVEVYCDSSGTSRGIALIEFHSLEAALRAHQQFHGKLIDKVSIITVEIVAVPASPALDPPPPPPIKTTTIQPPSHFPQQQQQQQVPTQPRQHLVDQHVPRPKHHGKPARPAPSKLSLKQRLALPSPPPPKRFLFTTPASGAKGPKAMQKKGKLGKQKHKPFPPLDTYAKKPRHSKPAPRLFPSLFSLIFHVKDLQP